MINYTFSLGKGWRRRMRQMRQRYEKEKAKEQEKKKFNPYIMEDRRPGPIGIKSSTKLFEENKEVDARRRKRT